MKAVIIGNGSSVKDYKAGSIIDSEFDIVIRFNRGFLEGVDKYREFVGSKTTTVVVHSGFIYPDDDNGKRSTINTAMDAWNWDKKMKQVNTIQLAIANMPESVITDPRLTATSKDMGINKSDFVYAGRAFRCQEAFHHHKCFREKHKTIPRVVSKNLQKAVNFGQTWPSTGLVGLYYNADLLRVLHSDSGELYMYGFDGADKKYKYYHYFDYSDKRTTEFHWRADRVDHNLDSEIHALQLIKDTFNIKELKDEL
jgi:hypothetical protein